MDNKSRNKEQLCCRKFWKKYQNMQQGKTMCLLQGSQHPPSPYPHPPTHIVALKINFVTFRYRVTCHSGHPLVPTLGTNFKWPLTEGGRWLKVAVDWRWPLTEGGRWLKVAVDWRWPLTEGGRWLKVAVDWGGRWLKVAVDWRWPLSRGGRLVEVAA